MPAAIHERGHEPSVNGARLRSASSNSHRSCQRWLDRQAGVRTTMVEKGLLWLRGDTSHWDVHYAFFARGFGQQMAASAPSEDTIHLFTAQDVIAA